MSFKVPFAFHVTGKNFTAGKYVVHQGNSRVPSLQNVATGQLAFVVGVDNSLTGAAVPALVFDCYAGAPCFLSEIHTAYGFGTKLALSKVEKEIARSDQHRERATVSIGLRNAD